MTTESIHHRSSEAELRMATVYLRSVSGKSLLTDTPTAATIHTFRPAPDIVAYVKQVLTDRGFTIESEGITLSISGPQSLFEKHGTIQELHGKEFMKIKNLDRYIDGIEFAVPGAPFERSNDGKRT
jgi:hypothetical protein